MLMQIRSGFSIGAATRGPPAPTLVGHSEAADNANISMPGGIASGDLGIFIDVAMAASSSTPPTDTFPAGWTRIGTTQTSTGGTAFNAVRFNVGYKLLDGTETTLTGMSGAFAAGKSVLVFRKDVSLAWGTPADVEVEANNNYCSDKTVNVIAGPLIVVGYRSNNDGSLSMSPAAAAAYAVAHGNGGLGVGWLAYGSGGADNTIAADGGTIAIGGFYIPLT